MDLADAIAAAQIAGRRRADLISWGTVTKVETVAGEYRYTVQTGTGARTMPMLTAGVVVGDVVAFIDQRSPVGLGRKARP
jgi:hypothetical protein